MVLVPCASPEKESDHAPVVFVVVVALVALLEIVEDASAVPEKEIEVDEETAPSADGAVSSSTSISFSGTAEASSTISNSATNATTTTNTTGAWSLSFSGLAQGTSTILFYATDAAGNISASSSRIVIVDTDAPAVSLTISACNQSLSSNACLLATTTLNIAWSTAADDLDSYRGRRRRPAPLHESVPAVARCQQHIY
jgi:hypothetical protein